MHYYETKNHIISIGGNVFLVSCEEGLVPVAENTSDNEQNDKYRDDEDTSDDDQDLTWFRYTNNFIKSINKANNSH